MKQVRSGRLVLYYSNVQSCTVIHTVMYSNVRFTNDADLQYCTVLYVYTIHTSFEQDIVDYICNVLYSTLLYSTVSIVVFTQRLLG